MNNEHSCKAVGCTTVVAPTYLMCPHHWDMVPKILQRLIWHHYRAGQEIDNQPTVDYIATAFAAISCVALEEGKQLPTFARSDDNLLRAANPVPRKTQEVLPYPD